MAGYHTVLQVHRLEEELSVLGFMMCYPRHGWGSSNGDDYVAVKPKDQDSLPIYARDAQLFCGTLDDLRSWLDGVKWARQYDEMLRLTNDKKRERKEQDYRNQKLVKMIETGKDDSQ
jgi:hypothetical protein